MPMQPSFSKINPLRPLFRASQRHSGMQREENIGHIQTQSQLPKPLRETTSVYLKLFNWVFVYTSRPLLNETETVDDKKTEYTESTTKDVAIFSLTVEV